MTAETLARATDNALRAAQLPAETIEGLRAAANSPHLLPDAGFHSATDIDSLDGLAGSYLWSEELLAVRVITFTFAPGQVGSAGDYQIKSGPLVVEEGSFQCVPCGPTSTTVVPIVSKIDFTSSKSARSAPTMIDSVASVAPASPPLTGASITRTPAACPASASRAETSGLIEDMSMWIEPC